MKVLELEKIEYQSIRVLKKIIAISIINPYHFKGLVKLFNDLNIEYRIREIENFRCEGITKLSVVIGA